MAEKTDPKMTKEEMILQAQELGYKFAYGSMFPPILDEHGRMTRTPMHDWMIEAWCCRAETPRRSKEELKGLRAQASCLQKGEQPKRWLGFTEHLKRFIKIVWNEKNTLFPFEFNPNSTLIIDELFTDAPRFLGIAGHKSCSKTETLAVLCVACFLINPENTKCVATSYTIQTAMDKIWGRIVLAWNGACQFFGGEEAMPGKLKASEHKIVLKRGTFFDDTRGIELIPGEQSKAKKASARLQGIKADFILIAADELATLSHAIVKTCKENIATSNRRVYFVGSYNPDNFYDGSMEVSKPLAGWDSITVDSKKWRTLLGDCIHFDGLTSPNVLLGYARWKGLYTREQLMKDREWYGGEKTHGFWQMIRAFWSPTGASDAIYSGQEIETYHADRPCGTGWYWADTPTQVAGLDPSYRPGGDRAVAYAGKVGQAIFESGDRRTVFEFGDFEVIAEDVTKGADKPRQVGEGFRAFCEQRGISIENTAVDCTGAASFASLLRVIWGDGFSEIIFSESASDAPVSETEDGPASDKYDGRDSELWYSGKPLMRSQQIKGIHPDMADEMCNRTYREVRGKISIEKKVDMKLRTGKSPDIADAGFCCLDVARQKFGLISTERSRKAPGSSMTNDEFLRWAEQIAGVKCHALEFEGA